MSPAERRQAHSASTGVHPDSTYAYNALLADMGYPAELCRLSRVVSRMLDRASYQHQRWLEGGVPPLGTRDRALADARRRSARERRERRAARWLGRIDAAWDRAVAERQVVS